MTFKFMRKVPKRRTKLHKCLVGYSTLSSFLALDVINKNTYFQFGINGGKTSDNLAEFAQTALFQNLCISTLDKVDIDR